MGVVVVGFLAFPAPVVNHSLLPVPKPVGAAFLLWLCGSLSLSAQLPAPWKVVTLGELKKGRGSGTGEGFRLSGAEGSLWGKADRVPFVYTEPEGDFALTVKLGTFKPAGGKSVGGIEVRFLKDDGVPQPDDAHLYLGRRDHDRMLQILQRPVRGGDSRHRDLGLHPGDLWLRVVRQERVISFWFSGDGKSWSAPRYSAHGAVGRMAFGLVGTGSGAGEGEQSFEDVRLGPIQQAQKTTWLGNSLPGGGATVGHVQNYVRALWVDPENGEFFLNGEDENTSFNAWHADGTFRWSRENGNFQHGSAVAADAEWVYQALHRARAQKDGFVRIRRATGQLQGGPYLQDHLIPGMAVHGGSLILADATENRLRFWETKAAGEPRELRSVEFAHPGALAVDRRNGSLWVLRTDAQQRGQSVVKLQRDGQPAGVEITGVEWPRGVAVGPEGKVYVTDSGRTQQIHIFDENGKAVGRLGAEGGVWSRANQTVPGENHPLKFNFPNAVAVDQVGNLTVVNSGPKQNWGVLQTGSGSVIRKFNPKGELLWELLSTEYVDCGDFLPGADGRIVYSRGSAYQLDYTKAPGKGWQATAFTIDPFAYPDDPRLTTARVGGSWLRTIQGKPFLIVTDMVSETVSYFRSQKDSKVLVPSVRFNRGADNRPQDCSLWRDGNGDGRMQEGEKQPGKYERDLWGLWVDSRGDLWTAAKGGPIRRYAVQGLDEHGNPVLDLTKQESWPRPAEEFPEGQSRVGLERVYYFPDTDTMYLSGYTGKRPKPEDAREWGALGTELIRYDHWTKSRRLRWRIELPYQPNRGGHHSAVIKSAGFAGDYVFSIRSSDARVFVHRLDDGQFVTTLQPGPEVGGHCGLIDIMHGLNVTKRANGEYVVILEDDDNAKNILLRWQPQTSSNPKNADLQ